MEPFKYSNEIVTVSPFANLKPTASWGRKIDAVPLARSIFVQAPPPSEDETKPLGPAIRDVIFHKCGADDDAGRDLEGLGPVLSLLWLPLRAGVDLEDESGAPAALWQAALGYTGQLPGCERILWGHCWGESGSAPSVMLLTRWRSAAAWKTFQRSPGISIMDVTGLIQGYPLNETLCLETAEWDAHSANRIIEVSLITSDDVEPDAQISSCIENVRRRNTLATMSGSITSSTHMLERYAGLNPNLVAAKERADALPHILTGITLWREKEDYISAMLKQEIVDADKAIISKASKHIKFVARLQLFTPTPPPSPDPQQPIKASSLHELMVLPLSRRGKHAAGKPRSFWSNTPQMSQMNEYHKYPDPKIRWFVYLNNRLPLPGLLDIFRIPMASKSDASAETAALDDLVAITVALRKELDTLETCRAVQLCNVQDNVGALELLICTLKFPPLSHNPIPSNLTFSAKPPRLGSPTRRGRAPKSHRPRHPSLQREPQRSRPHRQTNLAEFVRADPGVRRREAAGCEAGGYVVLRADREQGGFQARIQAFSMVSRRDPPPLDTEFQKPKSSFKKANRFMLRIKILADIVQPAGTMRWPNPDTPPMQDFGGGYEEQLVRRNGQDMARFTTLHRWYPAESAASWYQEFAERLRGEDYERLGLGLDAMRLMARGGTESRFLRVVTETGTRTLGTGSKFAKGGVIYNGTM